MFHEYKTQDQILGAFREFFEWTYEVRFTSLQVNDIEQHVCAGWGKSDGSDLRLVQYVVHLHSLVAKADAAQRPALRAQARNHLKAEFSRPASSDASRILAVVHDAIETISLGATGVPRVAPVKAASTPTATVATTSTTPPQAPLTIDKLRALLQPSSGHVMTPTPAIPGNVHGGAHAMNPVPAQPSGGPQAPWSAPFPMQGAPDPIAEWRAAQAMQEEMQRQSVLAILQSNISRTGHETLKQIAGNIRA